MYRIERMRSRVILTKVIGLTSAETTLYSSRKLNEQSPRLGPVPKHRPPNGVTSDDSASGSLADQDCP